MGSKGRGERFGLSILLNGNSAAKFRTVVIRKRRESLVTEEEKKSHDIRLFFVATQDLAFPRECSLSFGFKIILTKTYFNT